MCISRICAIFLTLTLLRYIFVNRFHSIWLLSISFSFIVVHSFISSPQGTRLQPTVKYFDPDGPNQNNKKPQVEPPSIGLSNQYTMRCKQISRGRRQSCKRPRKPIPYIVYCLRRQTQNIHKNTWDTHECIDHSLQESKSGFGLRRFQQTRSIERTMLSFAQLESRFHPSQKYQLAMPQAPGKKWTNKKWLKQIDAGGGLSQRPTPTRENTQARPHTRTQTTTVSR